MLCFFLLKYCIIIYIEVIVMKIVKESEIVERVKHMCMEANYRLEPDVLKAVREAEASESSAIAKDILGDMLKNLDIADREDMPICQDTGMAVFFVDIGREVHIDGNITDAINEGVRRGYKEGYLRASIVSDPIERKNTGDNTPSVIHYDIVEGDEITIKFAPKGFGSENMGKLKMLKPSEGIEGIKKFVIDTVREAGPNPCPPIVVGIGIGGTMDKACQLAKKALFRELGTHNEKSHIEELEVDLLKEINELGIGPQGFGGDTTALGLNIETFPTHIAGLPVAVNINCHVSRHREIRI
jgi:fumarate hydratase subunit alpha